MRKMHTIPPALSWGKAGCSVSRFAVLKPSDDRIARQGLSSSLLLVLFVFKQIADLGQQLHVGGGSRRCGRFLFLFLLQFAQQADQ